MLFSELYKVTVKNCYFPRFDGGPIDLPWIRPCSGDGSAEIVLQLELQK